MNRLHKMFEPDLVAALEKYREDQLDNPDLEEVKTRILIDWFIAHRYLPLGGTQKNETRG